MDPIIKYFTKFFIGPIFVFAVYVVTYGHVLPGEGFDGGALISTVFILCMIVFGREETRAHLNISVALIVSALAALGMIAIGFLGFAGFREGHRTFFDNFLAPGIPRELFSGGIVPLLNLMLGIIIGAGFYALFGYIVTFRKNGGERK